MPFENLCHKIVITALVVDHDVVVFTLLAYVPINVGFAPDNVDITFTFMEMIILNTYFTSL